MNVNRFVMTACIYTIWNVKIFYRRGSCSGIFFCFFARRGCVCAVVTIEVVPVCVDDDAVVIVAVVVTAAVVSGVVVVFVLADVAVAL